MLAGVQEVENNVLRNLLASTFSSGISNAFFLFGIMAVVEYDEEALPAI